VFNIIYKYKKNSTIKPSQHFKFNLWLIKNNKLFAHEIPNNILYLLGNKWPLSTTSIKTKIIKPKLFLYTLLFIFILYFLTIIF